MTIGVEEEFLVVDPATRRTAPHADAVLKQVGRLPEGARVHPELLSTQVEFASGVCDTADELRKQLVSGRAELRAAARREKLGLISSGTAVLSGVHVPVTAGARFERIRDIYQGVVEDYQVSGCHVHVGIPDRDTAVAVINHMSYWLPTLLALSANSPFENGRDTGYASWRTVQQGRFPGSGLTPWFGSAAEYDHFVDHLVDCGVLVDHAMTFWLARPSPRYPTIEVRVADAAATVDEAVQQAVLTEGLVRYAQAELDAGREAKPIPDQQAKAAIWAAARHGMTGPAIDLRSGRPVPALAMLAELTDLLGLPEVKVRPRVTGDPAEVVDALMEDL
ncbi:YbdK family carboxylate-amine ligase [Kibdelosporangium philippinense]|uniref:Putative glutamate--cysteine ligase 2 n=1 Tax=Kibdelosporangium philippinense TaxID=211113 RepID=A0ABS8ZBF9_9PSEU|nr:YbdK family carboxylate-amine ligase [Kibdelosporangium philippinense]MCE7004832.1 YbdK family carboxylate-amine ligase [Kibdelosporangium philippinense]